MDFVNLDRQYKTMSNRLMDSCQRVLKSGHFILGENVKLFEKKFSEYCGMDHCIGVASGLDAIRIALEALEIGEGDEVIVPANTYIATWIAVAQTGAEVVPVEPDKTYCIDPSLIQYAISPKTRAVIPVHLFGMPCNMEKIHAAIPEEVHVISDCAQSHGALYEGENVSIYSDVNCYSFYPTKPIGACGDAGAIVTNWDVVNDRARMIRQYGEKKKYHNEIVGINSRLDELQAAILLVKLEEATNMQARRIHRANMYINMLDRISELTLPKIPKYARPAWHQFVVRCERRDELKEFLEERDIPTLIHYPIPPHTSSAFRYLKYKAGDFPITEHYTRTMLSLPIDPYMTGGEQDQVIIAIKEFFEVHP